MLSICHHNIKPYESTPMTDHYKTILFDLDGTLIDHFTAIYRCYCFALEKMGMEPVSYERVRATVGGSVPVTMSRLVGESLAAEAVTHFRAHFEDIMLEDLHPLPGIPWLLEALKTQGKQVAVFTNKAGPASRKILEHLGYTDWLDATFGTMDTPWRKPEPEFTAHALEHLDASPETSLLIGDSPFDLAAARTHSISCHLVGTGSHTVAELTELDPAPDGVWKDCVELAESVFGFSYRETANTP